MEEHIKILELIRDNGFIRHLDDSYGVDLSCAKELYDQNLFDAVVSKHLSGNIGFNDVRINMLGREWLNAKSGKNTIALKEDVIELKPNFMGLGVNLNALCRRLFRKDT
ncbi:hypothetical protein [Reinekea thalattae]|uniref:DUF2513 domain-containing protein n=1 Tax=Reinekea thalattae TaxID=2593301 RepID=A0A5C8Z9Y3_9GAMM|nr:hypothetical protein [Reinekea thalattae]TXR53971.1 hypothetical protein FME95_05325 [Reinekea thalattae]